MATQLQTTAVIRARDLFSGPVTRMANRVLAAQRRIQTASRAARSVGAGMSVGITAPTAMAARSMFNTSIAFDTMRNSAQAAGRLTNEQIAPVEALARKLGATTQFTAAQSMGAARMLFKSGMDVEKVLGILKGTLDLAAAGELDLAQAADIATNVLTAMKLPMHDAKTAGESLTRVNDALAYAAANSNTDVRNLGESFKYAGPLAAMVGMSVEDLSAAFMTMAQSGIKGSEAGVAMRSAIVRMLRPTKGMRAELADLGIDLRKFITGAKEMSATSLETRFKAQGFDLSGVRGEINALFADPALREDGEAFFSQLSQTIAKGLGDTSTLGVSKAASVLNQYLGSLAEGLKVNDFFKALRTAKAGAGSIARVFDAKQGARLATLVSTNLLAENMRKVKTEAQGASSAMAKILMRGAPGEYKKMTSAYEGMMLAIAKSGVMSAAASAMNTMASAFKTLSETSPALLKWGTFTLLALAAIGPLAFGIGGLVSAYGALSSVLGPAVLGVKAMRLASSAGAATGLLGMGKGAKGLSSGLKGLPGRLRSMVAGLVMLSSVSSLKDILGSIGRGLLAIGKAPFGAIASGIRAVWAAAALLIGSISWPVVLGAAALALVIGHWKEITAWVGGFWDELSTGIADSKIGKFFTQLTGWIDMALKPLKMLWSYMKRLFGFGGKNKGWAAGEAELSGRSTARKILDFVGLSSAKREPAATGMPAKINSAIAHGAATTSGGGDVAVKPGLKVHAPATIHLTVGNNADAKDILDTINKAMDARDEKLKSSLQGAFND